MTPETPYWNQKIETMPREGLEEIQTRMLRDLVDRAYRESSFYRDLYRKAGVTPGDIRTLDDVRHLPFVDKSSAREAYPMGMLMVPIDRVREVHSATTPSRQMLPVYATGKDLEEWGERCARILWMTGLRRGDIIQNAFRFGLSTGGFGFHYGAMAAGMISVPASIGSTDRQIDLILDLGTTGITMMPSYAFYLGMRAHERGIDLARQSNLKVGLFGAEPTSVRMKERLGELLGLTAFGEYGMNEFLGPGMACQCLVERGMHAWADHFLLECIDPETGQPVPEGEQGELVWTWLSAEATAVIRYRSHDISRITWERCLCGRTHPRVRRIVGRTDGALSVGGYIIYPSKIQDVVHMFPEFGPFHVLIDSSRGLDCMTVRVEVKDGVRVPSRDLASRLRTAIRSYMTVTPLIEVMAPGTLAMGEGSACRILDYRRGSGRYGSSD
ncbi:MAG: phenylacetate--CoA ligase [bacterium]|nr:MAG: phenylacetate--CoA ligase [bacterium]